MKIFTYLSELQNAIDFNQLETPVAITAPFIDNQRVTIGLYSIIFEYACIDTSIDEFQSIKEFLYHPQAFRLATHGIQRIWKTLELPDYDTNAGLILDTEIMAYLLNSGRYKSEYSLSHLVHEHLSEEYPVWHKALADNPYPDSIRAILAYDAHLIYDLAYELLELMDKAGTDLKFMYFYVEVPLIRILLEMSHYGVGVDGPQAAAVHRQVLSEREKLAQEITGSPEAKLWNPELVYELLREHGIHFYSADKRVTHDELKKLALKYPLAAQILEWRDMETDLNFLKSAAWADRVYPEWNVISKTGRIHASNPAVQNVNKETCRPLMVPAEGCVHIKADYKQMQMRLLSNFSSDPELVKAFQEGKDVHWLTAEMCGIQGATDKEKRDRAKEVNFGILFQMTPWGLAKKLGTDISTAARYVKAFWSRYSGAKNYLDQIIEDLKAKNDPKQRVIEGFSGRRRVFDKEFGPKELREARATILQQAEADVLTLAVVSLCGRFRKRDMKSRIVMILHDCIWVEAPMEEVGEAKSLLIETMRGAVEYPSVPLEVEMELARSAEGETA
jgi:DNA polymerase I